MYLYILFCPCQDWVVGGGGGWGQFFLLGCEKILYDIGLKYIMNTALAELKIATNMVANATKIFSLATKNSGLVATLATRFLLI